jgi:programmed cell death protein 5
MDHQQLQPVSKIDDDVIPAGFTKIDPNASRGGGGGRSNTSDIGPQHNTNNDNNEIQKQMILEQALTPEALERLRRIKLVKEKNVVALENMIVSMAMSGKLPGRINEGKLVEMLERRHNQVSANQKEQGKISIQRKKYAFESDDDDDDDDL